MKTEHENPPSAGPTDADFNDDFEGEDIAFDLQAEEAERSARALLQYLDGKKDNRKELDKTALSIFRSAIECGTHSYPPDFAYILATNSRILNAAFEHQLIRSISPYESVETTELALRMQSQIVRTIGAWSRLKSVQKKFETRKTN